MITVYGKKHCPQCTSTVNYLKRKGIAHSYIDLAQDEASTTFIRDRGMLGLPAVIVRDTNGNETGAWTGFRMDKLMKLSQA